MASERPAPPPARRRRLVALTALAAAALIVVVGALVWAALDDGPDEARADAEQACEIVDRLPDELILDASAEESRRDYLRLSAAQSLILAAQEGDDEYDALADVANRARTEHARDFQVSRESLDDLRSECEEIG